MPDRPPEGFPPRRPGGDAPYDFRQVLESLGRSAGPGRSAPLPSFRAPAWPFALGALLLWLGSGIFTVGPDERGIVLRFGRVVREVGPGPGWHAPWPFEEVLKPSVTQIRKEEFGFRTVDVGPPARYQPIDREALMLTGDENIVKLQFIVQYKVKPDPAAPVEFLFAVRDPRETVRAASEAAMRQVLGRNRIDDVLTEQRERIQDETHEVLQQTLDGYGLGLQIVAVQLQDVDPPDQVSDAFKDVISAQQDKERMINEARGYANDVVPKARGEAAQMVNEAEGYNLARIQEATGAANRFLALQAEYSKAREVTRKRLWLETMEEVLPRVNKIVIDPSAARQTVPYLPLDQLMPRPARAAAPAEPVAGREPSAAAGTNARGGR